MEVKNLKLRKSMLVFLLIFGMINVVSAVLVSNSYVEIAVDPTSGDQPGAFTMGTLQGDPGNANDDNKVLLYGHSDPWSSFTTIKVDGNSYRYGSYTMTLVTEPTASTNAITSTWRVNNIDVTQILTLITSSTTGRADTMEIRYTLTNNDISSHDVGVRVMLDTMLGNNDGAPFKVPGVGDVITEKEFTSSNIPDYWQAFDNLASPNVISQGTLRGGSATVSDRFIICHWGGVYATLWDYDVTPTQSVTGDSAVAIYWNPTSLSPGQSRTYITYYGLGKVTVSQGELTLGLTAPSNVTNCSSFTVVSYVSNTGGSTANDVVATISLPSGLTLSPGETTSKNLGNISASGSNQSSWGVEPTGSDCGDNIISVTVTSSNLESNTANVTVNVPEECCMTTTTTTTTSTTSTSSTSTTLSSDHVYVDPYTQTVNVGDNVTVTIEVNDVTDLYSFQLDLISVDPGVLEVVSVAEGDFLSSGGATLGFPGTINNTAGTITGFAYTLTGLVPGVTGSGTLATLIFTALAEGTSDVSLSDVMLSDSTTTEIPSTSSGGSVTVEISAPGDVNGDGNVNVFDLALLGQSWGSSSGDPSYDADADLNGDGVVNVFDLAILGQNWGT